MAKLGFKSVGEKVTAVAAFTAMLVILGLDLHYAKVCPDTPELSSGHVYRAVVDRRRAVYLTEAQSQLFDVSLALCFAGLVGNILASWIRERAEKR